MKNGVFAVVLLTVMPVLSGCLELVGSSQVRGDGIYQYYSAKYSEAEQKLEARAEFNVGGAWGTRVELEPPSTISFDGMPLHAGFLKSDYHGEWSGRPFSPFHSWEWSSPEGALYRNTATIQPVYIFEVPAQLNRYTTYRLTVSGLAPTDQDRFEVTVSQNFYGVSKTVTREAQPDGRGGLSFRLNTYDSMADLDRGPGTLTVSRVRITPLQNSTPEGGMVRVVYESAPAKIYIVD